MAVRSPDFAVFIPEDRGYDYADREGCCCKLPTQIYPTECPMNIGWPQNLQIGAAVSSSRLSITRRVPRQSQEKIGLAIVDSFIFSVSPLSLSEDLPNAEDTQHIRVSAGISHLRSIVCKHWLCSES